MNIRRTHSVFVSAIVVCSLLHGCSAGQIKENSDTGAYQTGMADIDQIRSEVATTPTTIENAKSRHAALNRWWRLLWRQGFNMDSFDSTARTLVLEPDYSDAKIDAISHGYNLLENLAASPVLIPEITKQHQGSNDPPNPTTTDWPFYHGVDIAQTGYSPDVGPSEGKLAWRFPQSFIYSAAPVIDDGKIYLCSPGVDVIGFCLDEISGKVEWRVRQHATKFYGTPKANLSPAVSKGRVSFKIGSGRSSQVIDKRSGKLISGHELEKYLEPDHAHDVVATGENRFRIENASTGKVIREYETEQELVGNPVLYNGRIFASCKEGMVYAYSAHSKDLLWKAKLDATLRGGLEAGISRLYAGSSDGKIFALDMEGGKVQWTYKHKKRNNNSYTYFSLPFESKNRLFLGTADSELLCVDKTNGDLIWKIEVGDWIRSRPLIVKDTIYAATLGGDVYSIRDNGSSGEVLKKVHLGDHGISVDLRGNENGILAAGGGLMLYSLSPDTLEVKWKHGILDGAWVDGEFVMADWTGGLQPSPTVVDGILYCGGMDGFVFALDAESGKEKWRFEAGGRISAAVTVAEGKVFFGEISGDGRYYALDKNTGELVWHTDEFNNVWVGASYTSNGLYLGNMEGMMFGVNPEDGRILWSYDTAKDTPKENWRNMNRRGHGWPPGIYPVPVADEEKVYIGSWSGYYFAFDQKTGQMLWRTQTNDGNLNGGLPDSAAPVLWKGYVYVQKTGSVLAALNSKDGAIDWEWRVPRPFLQNGTIAAHGNTIYASYAHRVTNIPYNATIIAFSDVESGSEELWKYKGGGGLTAPVMTDGKLITGSSCDPFIVCLDPEDGSVIWRFFSGGEMRENVPAIYGNKVFIHSNKGWLYAIK
ncbi:MAG: PQQ-binding-like beta-propeller repeat protein [Puniceicoccaceae bacterium]